MNEPLSQAIHADARMRATFDTQRAAFLRNGAPPLLDRLSDLKKLGDAVGRNVDRLAAAFAPISAIVRGMKPSSARSFPSRRRSVTRAGTCHPGWPRNAYPFRSN